MKTTVYLSDFVQAFRALRPDNFSYEGLEQLFDYLTSYEEDGGEELELDVIALCCEYSEEHYTDIAANYDVDIEGLDEDEAKQAVMDYLCDNTSVIGEANDSFIYQVF